jgi:hypothetical protein
MMRRSPAGRDGLTFVPAAAIVRLPQIADPGADRDHQESWPKTTAPGVDWYRPEPATDEDDEKRAEIDQWRRRSDAGLSAPAGRPLL